MARENSKVLVIDADKAFAGKMAEISPIAETMVSRRPPILPPISSFSTINFLIWKAKRY
jgi:hypothetical protein